VFSQLKDSKTPWNLGVSGVLESVSMAELSMLLVSIVLVGAVSSFVR